MSDFVDILACPLCHGYDNQPYPYYVMDKFHGEEVPVTYNQCNCGMVFAERRLTDQALKDYYAGAYRENLGGEEVRPENIAEQSCRADALEEALQEYLVGGNALDIGSSAGVWLERLRDKYNYAVAGVEPGVAFKAYQNARGVPTYSYIDEITGAYDLVTIIHTLEHIPDPVSLLLKIARNNAHKDTVLVVEVPDLVREPSVMRLAHPVIFTPATLAIAFKLSGWKPIQLDYHRGTAINSKGLPKDMTIPAPNILGIAQRGDK